jgi:protein SCO1/2
VTAVTKTVLLCVALVATVLGAFVYSVTRAHTLSGEELRELGVFILPEPRQIAPFALQTAQGEPFESKHLDGRWSLVFFGFTHCPDICPTTLAVMAQAQQRLEAEGGFRGVMVSVDPERDEPSLLAAYVGAFSPAFVGVTGPRKQIVELARQVNVAFLKVPAQEGGYSVDHSGQIVIINPQGQYHGFIKMPHVAETIVQTFRALAAQ